MSIGLEDLECVGWPCTKGHFPCFLQDCLLYYLQSRITTIIL